MTLLYEGNEIDDNLSSSGSDRHSDAELLELPSDSEANTTTEKSKFKDGFRPAQNGTDWEDRKPPTIDQARCTCRTG